MAFLQKSLLELIGSSLRLSGQLSVFVSLRSNKNKIKTIDDITPKQAEIKRPIITLEDSVCEVEKSHSHGSQNVLDSCPPFFPLSDCVALGQGIKRWILQFAMRIKEGLTSYLLDIKVPHIQQIAKGTPYFPSPTSFPLVFSLSGLTLPPTIHSSTNVLFIAAQNLWNMLFAF